MNIHKLQLDNMYSTKIEIYLLQKEERRSRRPRYIGEMGVTNAAYNVSFYLQ